MKIQLLDKTSREVGSVEEEINQLSIQLLGQMSHWVNTVRYAPNEFHRVEKDVAEFFLHAGGVLLAAVLVVATAQDEFTGQIGPACDEYCCTLEKPRKQTIMIRFLCGLVFRIVTLYCPPTRKKAGDTDAPMEFRKGFSPEQALLGFGVKCTPGLEEQVARAVALYPSIKVAQQELAHKGIKMNEKEIRRIAMQCGEGLLTLRCLLVHDLLDDQLEEGAVLEGKSVVVELDGGRVRTRKSKGVKKQGKHPKFEASWREPKLLVIYTVDENGRKEKHSRVWIDGTFQHANQACDLVVMHLRRLGASRAKSVTFIADGATWIWDRLDDIIRYSGIPTRIVSRVLDFYHASQHVSKALKELAFPEEEHFAIYRELRSELRQSRWQVVVDRLIELGTGTSADSAFWTEIRYLEKHGKGGHLCYVKFTRRGLPLGSGAIESTIRRVVNLRMKSNGTFWTLENAEKMLQLRCRIMSTEWDEGLDKLYRHRLRGGPVLDEWESPKDRYCSNNEKTEPVAVP